MFVEILKKMQIDLTNNIDNTQNSLLIKEISDKLSRLETNNANQKKSIDLVEERMNTLTTQLQDQIGGVISRQMDSLVNNMRDTIKSNNGDSQDKVLQIIKENNDLFLTKIDSITNNQELKTTFSTEIAKTNTIVQQETLRLLENFKQNDSLNITEKINELITQKYSQLDENIKTRLELQNNTHSQQNSSMFSDVISKLERNNQTMDIVSTYFQKQSGSNSKGKLGEAKLEIILSETFPCASIINCSGKTNMADFHIERKDKNKILIDTKDYDTVVPVKEVENIIRDVEKNKCNGILISQNSGIAQKENFEINVHNNNIIVFIHNCLYDPDKIKLAINIIDHLEPILINENKNDDETISSTCLSQINREYQELVSQKLNIIQSIKKTQHDLINQVQKIDLPALTLYLNGKFANTGKTGFNCEICNNFIGKNAKSLAAHQRKCKVVTSNIINIKA